MNLKFSDFKSFLDAVELIISAKLEEAKKILATVGKDIKTIEDIFIGNNGELFEILPDGSLVKVNLYIATKAVESNYSLQFIEPKQLYKYHIYRCSTISNMFSSGRKHRYKINTRDDGTFYFAFSNFRGNILKINENQKLNICKNCLKIFLQKNYASDLDVENFRLEDFHKQNSNLFSFDTSELEKGEDAKPNVYNPYWNEISTKIKIKKDYTCEECGFKPRDNYEKRFIHTHHINGDKTNNYKDNLKVLCIKCHSNIDTYHKQIKASPNYREFIRIQKKYI